MRVGLLQFVKNLTLKERRQQLLKEFETYPMLRKKRGSLHDTCKGFLSSLKEVFEVLPPPRVLRLSTDFKVLSIFSKNLENELNNKISEKQKRSVQKTYMSILFARKICISKPLFKFFSGGVV